MHQLLPDSVRVHGVLVHAAPHAPAERLAGVGQAVAVAQQVADNVGAFQVAHAQAHEVAIALADACALPRQVSFALADQQGALALADKTHDQGAICVTHARALAVTCEQGAHALAEHFADNLDAVALAHRGQA